MDHPPESADRLLICVNETLCQLEIVKERCVGINKTLEGISSKVSRLDRDVNGVNKLRDRVTIVERDIEGLVAEQQTIRDRLWWSLTTVIGVGVTVILSWFK